MTTTAVNPAKLGPAPATYTNGMLVDDRTMYISGQIGIDAQGVASPDFATQCDQVWANLAAILAESGMSLANIVKTTVFLVDRADYPTFVERRRNALQGHKPASTLVYVSGLVKPEWKVEIEAIAVR